MSYHEIEQTRARVAAAWGVEVSEVEYEAPLAFKWQFNEYFFNWGIVDGDWRLMVMHGDGHLFIVRPLRAAPCLREIPPCLKLPITRFLMCLNYDIGFMLRRSVTITAHDKLEWAMQMRDAGYPIEPRDVQ